MPCVTGSARFSAREIFWEHEGNRAMRYGSMKIVAENDKQWELYNLDVDRTETQNVAADQKSYVDNMAAKWDEWAKRVGVVPWKDVPKPIKK
jgi:arylsulfatase A-like enzyme